MHYITAAAMAFALGASARPQPQFPEFSYAPPAPSGPAPPPALSGGAPSAAPSSAPPAESGCDVTYVPIPSSAAPSAPASSGGAASGIFYPSYVPTGSVPGVSYSIVPTGGASVPVSGSMTILPMPPSSVAAPVSSAPAASAPASEASYVPSAAGSSPASVTGSVAVQSGSLTSGGDLPASSGTSALGAVQTVASGETFDCGMVMYDRGVSCTGQEEGGDSDAVFMLENGASLSNCIIGPNQIEGVHCEGACSLTNVWWSAVCEDAFTIKEQADGETTTIQGGGAYGAEDKVLQHNGGGTLSVSGFTVESFGKVYRSCGNCDDMYERHVIMDDITATSGSVLAGINSNYGDTATFSNIKVSDVSDICTEYEGNDTGDEPEEISSGPSSYCIYSDSDITEV